MLTVIGEALIDLVEDRGAPGVFRALPGGSPLNVAVGLARLGVSVSLLCRLSGDVFGEQLRSYALANGVDLSAAAAASEPTSLALAATDASGAPSYGFYVQETADWQWTDSELAVLPGGTTMLHTGSVASWMQPGARRISAFADRVRAAGGVRLSYDPNIRPSLMADPDTGRAAVEHAVSRAHLVKASDEDLRWLYPRRSPVESARAWAQAGPELVVLTLGGSGAVALRPDGRSLERAARPTVVADTVGAGDAFMAALLGASERSGTPDGGIGDDASLAATLDFAMTAASLACERPGADPPTSAQIHAALHG